ncbi:predicted protein [Pyrenophora tritici-repentis Pt-1C-BFP]|uniref:Uncharacterized protein n=1 Tax=Pyrenophora tritici-repentis (strain Pt-1C-BFP) TaxID=426418 RepID=B2WHK8_PYRTR|nr:uncharacterized protein PTRG_09467 [Pyrenophora tritici-repentis Pt-1C-BFP]EDU42518.1 predicted protein [Pyrenophora tritici-repentis Pt-1C-BFP]
MPPCPFVDASLTGVLVPLRGSTSQDSANANGLALCGVDPETANAIAAQDPSRSPPTPMMTMGIFFPLPAAPVVRSHYQTLGLSVAKRPFQLFSDPWPHLRTRTESLPGPNHKSLVRGVCEESAGVALVRDDEAYEKHQARRAYLCTLHAALRCGPRIWLGILSQYSCLLPCTALFRSRYQAYTIHPDCLFLLLRHHHGLAGSCPTPTSVSASQLVFLFSSSRIIPDEPGPKPTMVKQAASTLRRQLRVSAAVPLCCDNAPPLNRHAHANAVLPMDPSEPRP